MESEGFWVVNCLVEPRAGEELAREGPWRLARSTKKMWNSSGVASTTDGCGLVNAKRLGQGPTLSTAQFLLRNANVLAVLVQSLFIIQTILCVS